MLLGGGDEDAWIDLIAHAAAAAVNGDDVVTCGVDDDDGEQLNRVLGGIVIVSSSFMSSQTLSFFISLPFAGTSPRTSGHRVS